MKLLINLVEKPCRILKNNGYNIKINYVKLK